MQRFVGDTVQYTTDTVQYAPILHRQISDWHVALLKTRD